jgi:hypothetical protein
MIHLYAPREWLERELEAMQTAFQLASLVLVIAWVALPLLLLGALTYARIVSWVRRKDCPPRASKFESPEASRF